MTTLVVDGYNAIHAIPDVRTQADKSLLRARSEIIALSREYARVSGFIGDVKVVFDGDDRYRYLDKEGVDRDPAQIFSATGEGDDKIIEVVKECSRKGKVIIASNDNYVRNNACAHGAVPINSQDLIGKKVPLDPNLSRDWKKLDKAARAAITRAYSKHLGISKG